MTEPVKPPYGDPCNGCGFCCQLETCPLARLRYWRIAGPCPALVWNKNRYECGMLMRAKWWRPLVARWIAVGIGCDCPDPASHNPVP